MALEHKLAAGIKRYHEKEKSREAKKEKKTSSKNNHVEIKRLDKGYMVRVHPTELDEPGGYRSPKETAHNSMHQAFKYAKECMGMEDPDEGKMS